MVSSEVLHLRKLNPPFKRNALNDIKGQTISHGNHSGYVYTYRCIPLLKLFIDQFGGDVNNFAQAMFIKGNNITRAQAYAMKVQASHLIQSSGRGKYLTLLHCESIILYLLNTIFLSYR